MSDLAFHTAKAIVEDGSIFEMDDFCEAVEQIVKDKIGHAVQEAIDDIDIDEIVKNEMRSYDTLTENVEELQNEKMDQLKIIETLNNRLENQNEMIGRLFKRVVEIADIANEVKVKHNALVDQLRDSWLGWLIF